VPVEVVVVLPIEGVLDYGSRGGVNRNSIQQSAVGRHTQRLALGTWHLAFGHPRAALDAIKDTIRVWYGGFAPLGKDLGLNA
jgi:hypothetical protein